MPLIGPFPTFRNPTPNDWLITLDSGQNTPQGFVVVGGYAYVLTFTSPSQLIKIDLTNPSSRTTLAFDSDGNHDSGKDLQYSSATGKLYTAFTTLVVQIDPAAMTYTDVVTGLNAYGSLITDATYLYVSTASQIVRRFLLSDFSAAGTVTIGDATFTQAQAMRLDSTKLFIAGTGNPIWVARIDLATFALDDAQHAQTGDNNACDDMALTASDVWTGAEAGAGNGIVLKISKADLTSITRINTGLTVAVFGIYYQGGYIWAVYNKSPGVLVRIDPTTLEIQEATFASGQNLPNEIQDDGTDMYFTFYMSPAKVCGVKLSALPAALWPV